ncbi:DUF6746 family protein [Thalassotalea agarivorans]|uniref:Uncharacterized protein n=1 Tax=Thalassotalea agarivorans TaxID=349064 RepID=A0A1I0ETB7_THASX|nr:DUF6746 family protein [Thalassotalea agarivorans]SET47835.1 hypothetical protein SAMN05660429_01905 [Thalassotalea agarivorans]
MVKIVSLLAGTLIAYTSASYADERYDHFPALAADNTTQALCNLAEYNAKLQVLLTKDTLTAEDMVKVHELTYTLENAIQRIQKDLTAAATDLEEVHLASEKLDKNTVQQQGKTYLTALSLLTSPASCK